jgi:hypothetical protein
MAKEEPPVLDDLGEMKGVPFAPPDRMHLRGQLTGRIRDALEARSQAFKDAQDAIQDADDTYQFAVSQAWAQYDADMARAGHTDPAPPA